jgi:hypothetical protein
MNEQTTPLSTHLQQTIYDALLYLYGSRHWLSKDAIDELRGIEKPTSRMSFGWTDPRGVFGNVKT